MLKEIVTGKINDSETNVGFQAENQKRKANGP